MRVRWRFFSPAPLLPKGTWEQLDANQSSRSLHCPNSNEMAQVGEMEALNGPVRFHSGTFHSRNYLGFGLLAPIRQNWKRALNEKGLISPVRSMHPIRSTAIRPGKPR